MTKQDAKEFIVQSIKDDVDVAEIAEAIGVLEQGSETENDISKIIKDNCCKRSRCKDCKYFNLETIRCRLVGIPLEWELDNEYF